MDCLTFLARGTALDSIVSFSSSASLSEVDEEAEGEGEATLVDLVLADFVDFLTFLGLGCGASCMSTSEEALLEDLSSSVAASLAASLLLSLLLVSSPCLTSQSRCQSLKICSSFGVFLSSFFPRASSHPFSVCLACLSFVNSRLVELKPKSVRKTPMRVSRRGLGAGRSGTQ